MFRAALQGWKVGDGAGTSTPSESLRVVGFPEKSLLLLKCCLEPVLGDLERGQGPNYCPNQTVQETNAVLTLFLPYLPGRLYNNKSKFLVFYLRVHPVLHKETAADPTE